VHCDRITLINFVDVIRDLNMPVRSTVVLLHLEKCLWCDSWNVTIRMR